MSVDTLQLSYRPKYLDDIVGNSETVNSLKTVLERDQNKIPRSYLFHGHFGCGKTTLAKVICNELDIEEKDIKFMNMSNYTGVDHMRDLLSKIRYKPLGGSDFRAYIMDEVHELSTASMNCLLNDLENPPDHVIFILCTTDPQKLKNTIRSRCYQYQVKPLNSEDTKVLLNKVAKAEKKKVSPKITKEIFLQSEGTPRDALILLDKIINIKDDEKALQIVQGHINEENEEAFELCKLFINGTLTWKKAKEIIKNLDGTVNYEQLRIGMMNYCESVLLNNGDSKCFALFDVLQEKTFIYTKRAGLTWVFYYLLNEV